MSKIKVADFYYGSVLSMLFNNHIDPALIESGEDRQVYDFTTNNGEFRLYIKYRADKQNIKTENYNSWLFALSEADKMEILKYIQDGHNLMLTLVCGVAGIINSEIAILDKEQVSELIKQGKTSITISRMKKERSYRISIGGGRDNAMLVKCNRFDELLLAK